MKARITITMDNAAFDDYRSELARILRGLAKAVEDGFVFQRLWDINGNHVGDFKIIGSGSRKAA